jgi:hypothetical protein
MAEPTLVETTSRRACVAAALFVVAPMVLAVPAPPAQPAFRSKAVDAQALPALTYAAGVADDVTPAPMVTSPSETVAPFSIGELPHVASVVQVRCVDLVALARIGGLYGP